MDVDIVDRLLGFVDKYGLSIVLAVIFIYQSMRTNRKMEIIAERNDELMRKVLDGKLCATPLTASQMDAQKEAEHAEQDQFLTKINMRKIDIMTRAKRETGASRVQQFAYHNNAKDYLGRSFQRMSCENEVVAPGVIPVQNNYNNIFRSFFYFIYKGLNESRCINVWDINTLEVLDMGMYDIALSDNIKAVMFYSIQNEKGNDVGYVCFTFDHVLDEEEDAHIPTIVKDTAIQLQGLNYTDSEGR